MMRADPYKRRQGSRPQQYKGGGQVSLRQPSRQPDGSLPPSSKTRVGDIRDAYLTGKAGGEAHWHYDTRGKK